MSDLCNVSDEIIGQVAKPDDFIVSERLVSLALTQLSENPAIYPILRQLLNAEGVHLYLVDQATLPLTDVKTFDDVVVAALEAGAIAIGFQSGVVTESGSMGSSITLNPDKSAPLNLSPADRIVLLLRVAAEDRERAK